MNAVFSLSFFSHGGRNKIKELSDHELETFFYLLTFVSIISAMFMISDGATNSGVSPAKTSNRNFKTPASFKQVGIQLV